MNRRELLTSTALTGVILAVKRRAGKADDSRRSRITPVEIRRKLRGPILSFPNCFTADFQLDFPGMGRMIDQAIQHGVGVVTLTSGNSGYDTLSFDEIKRLTSFMVEAVDGRVLTIAATGPWWTGQALEYAEFAEAAGADAVQVQMPSRGDDDGQLKHFQQIASTVKLPLVLQGTPSLTLWKRLLTIESLVAFKEESNPLYTLPLFRDFGDRLSIFAGGQDSRFLLYRPYGMQAYYSVFTSFAPEIAMQFWKAVDDNRVADAHQLVLRYDVPFFEQWERGGAAHAFWRATLEHFGMASRWLRPPEHSFTDTQMQEVRTFYDRLGLKPKT